MEFDFLGKDSIRYQNWVAVNKRVFKNLKIFIKEKDGSDDLFDRLNTQKMNEYLSEFLFLLLLLFVRGIFPNLYLKGIFVSLSRFSLLMVSFSNNLHSRTECY